MAAEKTTTSKTQKKDESGFFIIRTVKNARDNVSERLRTYNDKYLAKTIEKGRGTVKQYNEKYVSPVIEKGRSAIDRPYKKISKSVDDALAKGREFEKDAVKRFDEFVDNSRKYLYKVPMVETIEKRVSSSLNAVPRVINMPCKEDIDNLTSAMETLNANIETMKKQD
ncbi:MAG: hypothetical protein KGY61_08525 [Desulfobacterales bacterium]|nr:hypothetical protein [Desulfobacterales bacterium]